MASGSFNRHYPLLPVCTIKRRCTHIDPATGTICNKPIPGRNWRSRKPENKICLCEKHLKQKIAHDRYNAPEIIIEVNAMGGCML